MSCHEAVKRVFGNERPEVIIGCRKLGKDDFLSIVRGGGGAKNNRNSYVALELEVVGAMHR